MTPRISVPDYYANKSVFITGATGFLGKVLVEKLLRSCPEVKTLYLLVRPKRGQSPAERLQQLTELKLFENLRKRSPAQFDKLRLISGDTLQEDLGINNEDREELQRECHIIFHLAASVRFDISIQDSVSQNVVATKYVLQLAEGMKKLEVFSYCSTAYCHDEVEVLEEKLYPGRHRPQDVLDCMRWMDKDTVAAVQTTLIRPKHNVYSYTKALAEDLVAEYAGKFAIAVARVSIVTASLKEPLAGWIDNINGPAGVIYAATKGILHSMYCKKNKRADVVPVDIVVNGCIIQGYVTGLQKPKEVQVCNITLSGYNTISWIEASHMWRGIIKDYPMSECLWYPGTTGKEHKIVHDISAFFTHTVPAYLVDFLLILVGREPFLRKVQQRLRHGLHLLQHYINRSWHFRNESFRSFRSVLSEQDNETFYTDTDIINWRLYIRDYIKGIREFYEKEDPSTIPYAKKIHKRLYLLHVTTLTVLVLLIANILYRIFLMFW